MAIAILGFCAQGQTPAGDRHEAQFAADAQIAALVVDLSDSSYRIRTSATRRLCAIGKPAEGQLQQIASSQNVEAALRAKAILKVIDQLLFPGVEVTLSFSKKETRWDEPVELMIELNNPNAYRARVPFHLSSSEEPAGGEHVEQVTTMLDAADWLQVIGPDGQSVELVVDDITDDSGVHHAVLAMTQEARTDQLAPGQRVRILLHGFNRGWARYPLLDRGMYKVTFDYTPTWDDEVLARERAGRVASNPAIVTVVTTAPVAVSRRQIEAELFLTREGDTLLAEWINRRDVAVFVNKNFGPGVPFATGQWVYELRDRAHSVPVGPLSGVLWADFDEKALVEVASGERITLTRITVQELLESLRETGAVLTGDSWTIHFGYMNLVDRAWQGRADQDLLRASSTPEILRRPLPRRVFTSRQTSNQLVAPKPD